MSQIHQVNAQANRESFALESKEPAPSELFSLFEKHIYGPSSNPVLAIESLQKAADAGYADAQFELGRLHKEGSLVASDKQKAFHWLEAAASSGHTKAQSLIGKLFIQEHKYKNAVFWLRKTSLAEDAESQFLFAFCQYNGRGVPKDITAAKSLYKSAAQKHYGPAEYDLATLLRVDSPDEAWELLLNSAGHSSPYGQFWLGMHHELGKRVEKNSGKALEWFHRAAKQNFIPAQLQLAYHSLKNHEEQIALHWLSQAEKSSFIYQFAIPQKFFPSPFREYENECIEEQCRVYVLFELGLYFFRNGEGEKARDYLVKAATKGHLSACYHLGVLLQDAAWGDQDLDGAYRLFSKVKNSSESYGKAQYEIAWFHWRTGKISRVYFYRAFNKGIKEAFYFFGLQLLEEGGHPTSFLRQASEQKNLKAMCALAKFYGDDEKFADEKKELLREAAEGGYAEAQYILSCCFEGEHNFPQMINYLKQSAALGYEPAMKKLERHYHNGRHVPKDEKEGKKWQLKRETLAEFKKAKWFSRDLDIIRNLAIRGCGHSALAMAIRYTWGYEMAQDKAKALSWFQKAITFGHKGAKILLARCSGGVKG